MKLRTKLTVMLLALLVLLGAANVALAVCRCPSYTSRTASSM